MASKAHKLCAKAIHTGGRWVSVNMSGDRGVRCLGGGVCIMGGGVDRGVCIMSGGVDRGVCVMGGGVDRGVCIMGGGVDRGVCRGVGRGVGGGVGGSNDFAVINRLSSNRLSVQDRKLSRFLEDLYS